MLKILTNKTEVIDKFQFLNAFVAKYILSCTWKLKWTMERYIKWKNEKIFQNE
jgi:hypothetical protein